MMLPSMATCSITQRMSCFTKFFWISFIQLLIHSVQEGLLTFARSSWAVLVIIIGTPIPFEGRVFVNFGGNNPGVDAYSIHFRKIAFAFRSASALPDAFA